MSSQTPIRSIRRYCLQCHGGSRKQVRECCDEDCPLFTFRMGHNPKRQGIGGNPKWKRT